MTRLRSVDELPPEWHGADEARAALERIIAQRPVAVMIVFETSDRFGLDAVPRSLALMRGLADKAMGLTWPEADDGE